MPAWVWIVIVLAVVVLLGVIFWLLNRYETKEQEWYSNASLEEIAQVDQEKLAWNYMVWAMSIRERKVGPASGRDAKRDWERDWKREWERDQDQLRAILEKIRTASPEAAREGEAKVERRRGPRKRQA